MINRFDVPLKLRLRILNNHRAVEILNLRIKFRGEELECGTLVRTKSSAAFEVSYFFLLQITSCVALLCAAFFIR